MSFNQVNSSGELERVAGLVNSEKINEMYEAFPSDASASNKLVTENSISTKVGAITGSGITYRTFTCTLSNATKGYQNHEFLLVTREENVLINARIHTDGTLNVTACDINGEANTITNIGYAFDNTTRTLTIGVTLASWAMTLSVVKITYPKDVASTPIVVSTLPTLTDVTIKKLVTESGFNYKSGTKTGISISANSINEFVVTFDTPMPDTDYVTTVSTDGVEGGLFASAWNKQITGFSVTIYNANSVDVSNESFKWQAYKIPH